jgi:hypothetical protein
MRFIYTDKKDCALKGKGLMKISFPYWLPAEKGMYEKERARLSVLRGLVIQTVACGPVQGRVFWREKLQPLTLAQLQERRTKALGNKVLPNVGHRIAVDTPGNTDKKEREHE